jgi:hypothetical protein
MIKRKLTTVEQRAKRHCERLRDSNGGTIVVEWKKSRTWGSNPTIQNFAGEKICSVSGCGYCKHSTALADAMQFLGETEEQQNAIARTGGAGVSSVSEALRLCGWKLEYKGGSPTTDIHELTKI